jgi:hypothetical protein
MTQFPRFRTLILILASILFFSVYPIYGQESAGISREALYNSADGFHVLIPQGWDNQSTEAYAHFVHPQTQVNIYADSSATTDVQAGIDEVVRLVVPDFAGEPAHTSQVILSNGTWTQNVYQPGDESSLTAYGQVYEGSTYVVVWYSPQNAAHALIVPGEDAQSAIGEALNTLGYSAGEPTATEDVEFGEQVWTRNIYADVTALARARGDSTLVIVDAGTDVEEDTGLPVFFTLLTSFFLTPVTTPYLYLGLAVTAIVALVYIASLVLRARNLRKDMETLEALEDDARATA